MSPTSIALPPAELATLLAGSVARGYESDAHAGVPLAAHRKSSQDRAKKFAAGKNNNLIGLLGTTAEVAGSLKLRRRDLGRDPNLAPKKQKHVGGTITFAVGLHVCLVSGAAARADARARAARQKEAVDRRAKARSAYPMHAD